MEPSTIIIPRITDIGKMKHDIRIDLGLHFALEDIIDSRFAEHVIRYLQSHDLIRHYSDYEIELKPDVILASSPCERFSLANSTWPKEGIYTAFRVLGAVIEIISIMKPKGWIIENPKGRMRWFLQKSTATVSLRQFGYKTVKLTDFWSNLDFGILKNINTRKNPNGLRFDTDIMRKSSERAMMPYGLSKKVLESFEAMESEE